MGTSDKCARSALCNGSICCGQEVALFSLCRPGMRLVSLTTNVSIMEPIERNRSKGISFKTRYLQKRQHGPADIKAARVISTAPLLSYAKRCITEKVIDSPCPEAVATLHASMASWRKPFVFYNSNPDLPAARLSQMFFQIRPRAALLCRTFGSWRPSTRLNLDIPLGGRAADYGKGE